MKKVDAQDTRPVCRREKETGGGEDEYKEEEEEESILEGWGILAS